jgi:hypothetical protein
MTFWGRISTKRIAVYPDAKFDTLTLKNKHVNFARNTFKSWAWWQSVPVLQFVPKIFTDMEFRVAKTEKCSSYFYARPPLTSIDLPTQAERSKSTIVHSRRRDSVNKASPASPQLTARMGQSAQLVQCTRCIRTHVNLHSDFGHPCNGTHITWLLHDFIQRTKEISRAIVYDDSLVSANGP